MDKERHVRKSNILVEGRYRFGLNEQRILMAIISKIRIDDKDFKPYRFNWSDIRKITRNKIKTSSEMAILCEKLRIKSIQVNDGKIIRGFGFLASWAIDPGRYAEFCIDPTLKSMLLDLLKNGNFTLFKLECVLSLSSTYSVRLYELLKASEWKKQPIEIPLDKLKWSLGIDSGSSMDRRFDIFRSKILEKAKKDIEKHTDIKFIYRKILELRKVVSLQITISENKKYQPTLQSHVTQKDLIKDGDRVLLAGKEYQVQGNNVFLDDGCIPIGRLNQLLKKGVVRKL